MSDTVNYSKESEQDTVHTNFQPASEHHDAGKKRKTNNKRKGDGLIKGQADDSEYLSWFQRNRCLLIIVAIVAVIVIVAIVAIVMVVLVGGSKSESSSSSEQGVHTLSNCPDVADKAQTTIVIGDTCYHYVELLETKVTYEQAQADCVTRKGHLLTINDNSTQTTLVTKLSDISESHTILLGLKKDGSVWRWVTGKQASYVNWNPKTSASGDCAVMRLNEGGLWEPVLCGNAVWYTVYACEYSPIGSSSGHLTRIGILMQVVISLWITIGLV